MFSKYNFDHLLRFCIGCGLWRDGRLDVPEFAAVAGWPASGVCSATRVGVR